MVSPNQTVMATARQLFDGGNFSEAAEILEAYRSPDPVYDREKEILWVITRLELAKQAIQQKRYLYAQTLLQQTPVETAYLSDGLNRKKLLLLGSLPQQKVTDLLPSLDEELLLRAAEAFDSGNIQKSRHLLEAMENHSSPSWHLLRGKISLHLKQWTDAADHLHQAEDLFPAESFPLLEVCYRELEDFQKAYEYACKQRK